MCQVSGGFFFAPTGSSTPRLAGTFRGRNQLRGKNKSGRTEVITIDRTGVCPYNGFRGGVADYYDRMSGFGTRARRYASPETRASSLDSRDFCRILGFLRRILKAFVSVWRNGAN